MNLISNNESNQDSSNNNFNNTDKEALTFPEELFEHTPEIINDYMEFATPLSDTPNEFLLMPFISMAGAVIGKKRYILAGGTKILPIVWTVLFAGSSTMRKSTAISIAKKPYKDIESHNKKIYKNELKEWKQDKRSAERNDEPYDIPKPKRNRLFAPDGFSDLTFWEALRDNNSIVSIASEFTGLWTEINRPTANISELTLKLFDGEGGRRVTKSGGDITLNEPVWCIVGATTIENFRNALSSVQRDSGFLQRVIPICMEDNPKKFKSILTNEQEDKALRNSIADRLLNLQSLSTDRVEIAEEAERLYNNWSYAIHKEAEDLEDKISDIGGYYSRLSIYGLKIALIFQVLESTDEKITKKNMQASLILCNWIKYHIHYMLEKNYIFDKAYADRIKIREMIGKQPNKQITRTKLMNHSHFHAKRLNKALNSEIESGIIGKKKIETEGKDRTEYYLKN